MLAFISASFPLARMDCCGGNLVAPQQPADHHDDHPITRTIILTYGWMLLSFNMQLPAVTQSLSYELVTEWQQWHADYYNSIEWVSGVYSKNILGCTALAFSLLITSISTCFGCTKDLTLPLVVTDCALLTAMLSKKSVKCSSSVLSVFTQGASFHEYCSHRKPWELPLFTNHTIILAGVTVDKQSEFPDLHQ